LDRSVGRLLDHIIDDDWSQLTMSHRSLPDRG